MPINIEPVLRALTRELQAERRRIDREITLLARAARDGSASMVKAAPRRRWTKAARAATSRRMKAYWAKRRAQKAKVTKKKG